MKEYIKTMRRLVGHTPIMQVGASTILVNEKGELLLQQRSDNGLWGYHGGSVDLDEDVAEAAARELHEETGLVADTMELLGVFSGPDMHYVYPNGDEVSNVDVVYICRKYHGTIKAQAGEVEELRFFSPNEISIEMLSPPNRKAMRFYLDGLKK